MRFQSLYSARKYWVAGVLLAVAGVLLARVIAPGLEEKPRSAATAAGQLIALAGLVTISFGIRKRLWTQPAPEAEQDSTQDKR